MLKRNSITILIGSIVCLLAIFGWGIYSQRRSSMGHDKFDGKKAFEDVRTQLSFGSRVPGSPGHQKTQQWIKARTEANGWRCEIVSSAISGHTVQNIVARRGDHGPWIIVGAHYDTRQMADNDPDIDQRSLPVPGANDGASGVAVLLELSRVLPKDLQKQIWLVFFDAEDQGRIGEWNWILGSRAFAEKLSGKPDAVVVVDMIGDKELNLYFERNSDRALMNQIWATANQLGYQNSFIPEYRHRILDDHIPFIERDIPAVDLIDFDYPYWHTSEDTLDKISPESLSIVGTTLYTWLLTP